MLGQPRFVGSRVREARVARAMKAKTLAELLDVSPSSISQYESETQTPPPHVIVRMSEVLNLPAHFFTAELEPSYRTNLRWRSRTARPAARDSAEMKYEWFRRVLEVVYECVEFPPVVIPDVGAPCDPLRISNDDIENAAEATRREWGLGDGPISDTVTLVENNGIICVKSEMGDEFLDAFSDFASDGRSFFILGSDKGSAVRSRQDVAHETAHAVLHRDIPEEVAKDRVLHKEMEQQAFRFAGAFLLPESTFPQEVFSYTLDGLLHLKRRWGVSVSSMIMRLTDLGIIDESKKRYLFSQISRKKWRKNEPLDDTLEIEEPQLLRSAIDASLQEGVLDLDQLTVRTHLPIAEIERILGLEINYLRNWGTEHETGQFQLRLTH